MDSSRRTGTCYSAGVFRVVLLFLATLPLTAKDWYLFTSFRGNGETGLYLALSEDGAHWTALNDNKPWLKPETEGMLMRDPWLGRGPDGVWHLLWTCNWTRARSRDLVIGHASSTDLLSWTPQQQITVLQNAPTAMNAWAPEAVWDQPQREWIIFWATTIPGTSTAPKVPGDKGYDHRIYAATTR